MRPAGRVFETTGLKVVTDDVYLISTGRRKVYDVKKYMQNGVRTSRRHMKRRCLIEARVPIVSTGRKHRFKTRNYVTLHAFVRHRLLLSVAIRNTCLISLRYYVVCHRLNYFLTERRSRLETGYENGNSIR